ncbi:pyridoxine 5'-phosphate synthase [Puia sp. P3]|uniref:pyridoxine 5'-phosphate synthase n=1 Tax=Puia sp. P3 TaxID=3423952 RepID=UPI003D6696C9
MRRQIRPRPQRRPRPRPPQPQLLRPQYPGLDEVSIGHALICDALYLGYENTIQLYKRQLQ